MAQPQIFVTFSPENVSYQRKATMTHRKDSTSCELLELVAGRWQVVEALSSTAVLPILSHVQAWVQGK